MRILHDCICSTADPTDSDERYSFFSDQEFFDCRKGLTDNVETVIGTGRVADFLR